MTHEWQTDRDGCHVLGKMTDNYLINTKGVLINPIGVVFIANFGQDGDVTIPRLYCKADRFRIDE